MKSFRSTVAGVSAFALALAVASAQPAPARASQQGKLQPPVKMTSQQMHARMMKRLGIQELQPGPNPNPDAPNHANYNEALADPYPNLPKALVLKNGKKVTTAKMWWKQRRPQIVKAYEKDVYGFIPKNVPHVTWHVVAVDHEEIGLHPVIAKEVIGHVDNSSYPLIDVNIHMMVVTPANVKGPVPMLMMFGRAGFPAPNQPNDRQYAKINAALKALMVKQDPSLKKVFEEHPAWEPETRPPFKFPHLNADGGLPRTWELIDAGWGFTKINPMTVQADNGAGLTHGIIGLVNHGRPRSPEQWGALRAWAWGASQGLTYLRTDPAVNPKEIGIEGVSRFGKAALVAMAFDPRFAMVLVGSSGKGGATPLRRHFGEEVATLDSTSEFHWFAGNFLRYAAKKAVFGSMNPGDIPVDSNELIALCAPRLVFISYGIPSKGDARWLDQRGSWMATVDASKVWRLLGAKGLTPAPAQNYHTAPMPAVNHGLLGGKLAWRQDDGGHTDAPNVIYFIHWANKWFGYKRQPK